MLIPNFRGGISKAIGENKELLSGVNNNYRNEVSLFSQYWGNQPFTSGPVYAGAITCLLAFLGLFLVKGYMKIFLILATVLSIILSWGMNFPAVSHFFFYHIPGYNKFRSVSMILVIAEITLPMLAALALDFIFRNKSYFKETLSHGVITGISLTGKKLFFLSLIFVGGTALFCYITPSLLSDFTKENEVQQTVQLNRINNPEAAENEIAEHVDKLMPYVKEVRMKIFTQDALRELYFYSYCSPIDLSIFKILRG